MTSQRARIVAAHGRHYVVVTESGERLVCFTRGKKSEAACGDAVEIVATGSGQGVLQAVLPRRNLLSRSNGFRTKLLAANVDQIAIVVATSPPFSEELLGRTIVAAVSIDVPVRILLNKVDLVDKLAWARETLALYVGLGYPVHEVSIRRDEADAYAKLAPHFAGRTTLLVGQSGMGKSSLLNLLVPDAQAATREISEALQTGKHTTTDARLYALPESKESLPGALIDTPGFQEFGLAHLTPGTVERGFPELEPFLGQCRFANCMHLHEPGCAVLAARDRGGRHAAALRTVRTAHARERDFPRTLNMLLARADNLMIATLWQQVLASAGIRCEVRNRYIGAAVGELPADQVAPQVWLLDDRDETRARALLDELRKPTTQPAWCCFACGELVEAQFAQCWKCLAIRNPDRRA